MQRPAPSRMPRGSSTTTPKEPAPPTGPGGIGQQVKTDTALVSPLTLGSRR
jgi:hypothetical protein